MFCSLTYSLVISLPLLFSNMLCAPRAHTRLSGADWMPLTALWRPRTRRQHRFFVGVSIIRMYRLNQLMARDLDLAVLNFMDRVPPMKTTVLCASVARSSYTPPRAALSGSHGLTTAAMVAARLSRTEANPTAAHEHANLGPVRTPLCSSRRKRKLMWAEMGAEHELMRSQQTRQGMFSPSECA